MPPAFLRTKELEEIKAAGDRLATEVADYFAVKALSGVPDDERLITALDSHEAALRAYRQATTPERGAA